MSRMVQALAKDISVGELGYGPGIKPRAKIVPIIWGTPSRAVQSKRKPE